MRFQIAPTIAGLYSQTASATAGPLDLKVILERALEQVLPVIKSTKGFIHLWSDERTELYLAAYSGVSAASITELVSLRPGEQIIGRVFELEAPVSLPNIVTELDDVPANVPDRLFHAYLGVPVQTKGRTRGVFSVLRKAARTFRDDEVTLLTSIAGQIGVAVENARLYQRSHQLAVNLINPTTSNRATSSSLTIPIKAASPPQ